MTEPEQPANPPLTRKKLREIRNTGANPVISPDSASTPTATTGPFVTPAEPDPAPRYAPALAPQPAPSPAPQPAPSPAPQPAPTPAPQPAPTPAPAVPLARPAIPAALAEPPVPDAAVDLGVTPLTRRQARQQERIRTASVPVITPEVAASHTQPATGGWATFAPIASVPPAAAEPSASGGIGVVAEPETPVRSAWSAPAPTTNVGSAPVPLPTVSPAAPTVSPAQSAEIPVAEPAVAQPEAAPEPPAPAAGEEPRATVSPVLGAGLLADAPREVELPPSFDELLSHGSAGSSSTSNALIVSQTPSAAPIVAPVSATGEIIVTGTFNLPEGMGSTGHAPGTTDGKEADAVLVDGELPAHSSPTPISASAAISTVKSPGDIIKPPAPEKAGRLMMSLAITAGVLALALAGVLILAFATGVFS